MANAPPATRVSLGWAFWASGFCLVMIVIDALQRLRAGYLLMLAAAIIIVGAIVALTLTGTFASLSLAREYAARHDEFVTELGRHCLLVAIAVVLALLIGAPLGLYVARRPERSTGIFGALNLLQTIPSVALFGLLIVPLSALGIGGIGAVPAVIALVLYSLLPVVRNTEAGISGVDPAVIDAARGMGLMPTQILWRIELPLGMPVFLAGLRIVTVQSNRAPAHRRGADRRRRPRQLRLPRHRAIRRRPRAARRAANDRPRARRRFYSCPARRIF